MSPHRDVVPDVHGDVGRLEATLAALGGEARVAFHGDFIDALDRGRPADDAAVLTRVRPLTEDGSAVGVMGNHELNAMLYHTRGADGVPLRRHSAKNTAQHASFLHRFGAFTPEAMEWVAWFHTLPLWLDLGRLPLVHAGNPPVLVGHYRMTGFPCIETSQAACLDYPDTPCAYRWRGEDVLDGARLVLIGGRAES